MHKSLYLGLTTVLLATLLALSQMSAPSFVTQWGREGSGDGQFKAPEGIAVADDGTIYIADTENHRVQRFDANGRFLAKWGAKGLGDGQFDSPGGIALDKEGHIYIADSFNHRIQKFDKSGKFLAKWGTLCDLYGQNPFTKEIGKGCVDPDGAGPLERGDGQFSIPVGIALDKEGNLYITDGFNHRVQKFSPTGRFLGKFGLPGAGDGQFNVLAGIALDGAGNIYLSDNRNDRVQKFDAAGKFLARLGGPGDRPEQMRRPYHIALDSANNLYVANQGHHRIQIFDAQGNFVLAWGGEGTRPGQFKRPRGVAVLDALVYIADSDNHRVQKFEKR
jgi:DNA-binding beta-propeller fold protein YncE